MLEATSPLKTSTAIHRSEARHDLKKQKVNQTVNQSGGHNIGRLGRLSLVTLLALSRVNAGSTTGLRGAVDVPKPRFLAEHNESLAASTPVEAPEVHEEIAENNSASQTVSKQDIEEIKAQLKEIKDTTDGTWLLGYITFFLIAMTVGSACRAEYNSSDNRRKLDAIQQSITQLRNQR